MVHTISGHQQQGRQRFVLGYIMNRRNGVYEIKVVWVMWVTIVGSPSLPCGLQDQSSTCKEADVSFTNCKVRKLEKYSSVGPDEIGRGVTYLE